MQIDLLLLQETVCPADDGTHEKRLASTSRFMTAAEGETPRDGGWETKERAMVYCIGIAGLEV